MKEATLQIDKGPLGGGFWTYPDARFSEAQLESSAKLTSDGTIEVGHVDVTLHAETVMGAASVFGLPGEAGGESFRPRCALFLGEETLFEGTVSKTGISCSPSLGGKRVWKLRLEATALSDVMDYLEGQSIYAPRLLSVYESALQWISVETTWPGHPDSTDAEDGSETIRWYKLPALWRTVISEGPGINLTGTIPLFPHPRTGAATSPVITSLQSAEEDENGTIMLPHSLPDWTGKDLLETIQDVTGLRLRAEYGRFPSETIELTEIEGAWPEAPPVLPALGKRQSNTPYDLTTEEPEEADFALWYEGGGPESSTYVAHAPKPFTPEGEPRNAGTREIGLRLARIPETTTDEVGEDTLAVGMPRIEEDGTWIAAQEIRNIDGPRGLVAYRARSGDPPDIFNEVWLSAHLHRHPLAGAPLHQVSGTFDGQGLVLEVGVLSGGFELEGEAWMVRSLKARAEGDERVKVEGVRPTSGYDPTVPEVPRFGPPREARLYVNEYNLPRNQGTRRRLRLDWEAPEDPRLAPARYDVEFMDADGQVVKSVSAQATASSYETDDPTPSYPGHTARVRSAYEIAGGWTSDWITATL